MHLLQDDLDAAQREFGESLVWIERSVSASSLALILEGVAGLMIGRGRFRDAARCLGSTRSLRDTSTFSHDAFTENQRQIRIHAVLEELGETVYADVVRSVQALAFQEILALTRDMLGDQAE